MNVLFQIIFGRWFFVLYACCLLFVWLPSLALLLLFFRFEIVYCVCCVFSWFVSLFFVPDFLSLWIPESSDCWWAGLSAVLLPSFYIFFYYHFHKSNSTSVKREYIVKIACFYRHFISHNACLEWKICYYKLVAAMSFEAYMFVCVRVCLCQNRVNGECVQYIFYIFDLIAFLVFPLANNRSEEKERWK